MAYINNAFIYKLKIPVLFKVNSNICFIEGRKILEISNVNEEITVFIKELMKGIDAKFINEKIITKNEINLFYNWLVNKGWIKNDDINVYQGSINEKNGEYLTAINKDSVSILTTLKNKHISIVGCGGTGSIVAQALVAMGFYRLSLIDYDMVEASNLNRQVIYSYNDVGKNKAETLANKLKLLNPELKITIYTKKIINSDDLKQLYINEIPDLMVCAIDFPPVLSKISVAQFCLEKKVSCIFGSVGIQSGQYGPLLDQDSNISNFINFQKNLYSEYVLEDVSTIKGSLCATNSIISNLMALDIFKWFSKTDPKSLNRILKVSFKDLSIVDVKKFDKF